MPLGTLTPDPVLQIFDPLTGLPCSGAKIETYLSGTNTPEFVYTDSGLTVAFPNPVICDAAGIATIYLGSKSYRFTIKRSDGTLIRTVDPVSSVALATSLITQSIAFGGIAALGANDAAYPAGATLDKILFGTRIVPIDSANISGTWVLRGMLRSDNGASQLKVALVNLSDGTPDTPLVEIVSTNAIGELVTSGAIVFAAPGVSKNYAIKLQIAGGLGQAWNLELVRTA